MLVILSFQIETEVSVIEEDKEVKEGGSEVKEEEHEKEDYEMADKEVKQ